MRTTVASFKNRVTEHNISATTSTDIFSSPDRSGTGDENYMEFVVIGTGLSESTDVSTVGETYEVDPIYKVTFSKL